MKFSHFLSAYFPDPSYGGRRLYADMLEQARLAERLGFASVVIPEHHLINILLVPSPLQMAVKVASETSRIPIVTSVAVLPLHDMRIFAGEVVQADILCEGRLILGVGRGAFAYEMARLDTPLSISREKFDELLAVLLALLSREEVAWSGKYYNFEPLTIMPRPEGTGPQFMIAALEPEAIFHSAKRGFHVQTTPLQASAERLFSQVDAFHRGKAACGEGGKHLELSMLRVGFAARNAADAKAKQALAYGYYQRFDNVFTGPGIVCRGAIEPLPRGQTVEELAVNLLIAPAGEMIDRLSMYAEAGVDDIILNLNIGARQSEVLESMQRFAEEVMPHFAQPFRRSA